MDAALEDLDADSIPAEGRDSADEKVRVLGLIADRENDDAGDVCDLCTGHGESRLCSALPRWLGLLCIHVLSTSTYWIRVHACCSIACSSDQLQDITSPPSSLSCC